MERSVPTPLAVCVLFAAWTVTSTVYWCVTDDTVGAAAVLVLAQAVGMVAYHRSTLRRQVERLSPRMRAGTGAITLGVSLPAVALIAATL